MIRPWRCTIDPGGGLGIFTVCQIDGRVDGAEVEAKDEEVEFRWGNERKISTAISSYSSIYV
jgi:hypothetical protein